MFLAMTARRNSALIDAAIALHQEGRVPSNTYVVDVDAVAENARALARAGRELGLTLYQMTKQFGRNPELARRVAAAGLDAVAVDLDEARVLHHAGVRVRHLGHLVQLPRRRLGEGLAMRPDELTVFSLGQAEAVSEAAQAFAVSEGGAPGGQPVLLRVVGPDDTLFPHQRGGVPLADLVATARAVDALPGVRVAGVTAFPCLLWDEQAQAVAPTPNLRTLEQAAAALVAAGFKAPIVNAPSLSCVATLPLLRERGATHAEPGSALIGNTPLHALDASAAERPAMVYVTEVSHTDGDTAYTIGGGLYARSRMREAIVCTGPARVRARAHAGEAGTIDYYGTLELREASRLRPGDTVVYAFRSQAFVSRSYVAPVAGAATGTPALLGVYDARGARLGDDLLPLRTAPEEAVLSC